VAPFAEKPQLCFYSKLKVFIEKIAQENEFYAYKPPFEGEWLRSHLGIRLRVKGIMEPAKGITYKIRDLKGWNKTPNFPS